MTERILPKTISHKEFLEIIKNIKYKSSIKERKMKSAFCMGFYQAMRISEVLKLDLKDIDKERGYIHLLQAKGKKDRDVPIQKPVWKFLKYFPLGKGFSRRTLQREIEKWGRKVLDKKLTFHMLRHSGATFYSTSGMDMRHLQALLGHSRVSTTEIYTHITPSALKSITDKLWEGLE